MVVHRVPANVCDNCHEALVSSDVATELLELFEEVVSSGVIADVREYRVRSVV